MASWLDDHREQELATFRARFTDQQWEAFRTGHCWQCSEQTPPRVTGRQHGRVLCDPHTMTARHASVELLAEHGLGRVDLMATTVPSVVRSMDLSEVP